MVLPKPLMDFLRSRRFRIALACSPFAAAILIALAWVGINWYGRWKFDRTVDELVARGFARTTQEAIGPLLGDEDNLLLNPAVLREAEAYRLYSDDEGRKNGGWVEAMDLLEFKLNEIEARHDPATSKGYGWADLSDFKGPGGREEAQQLLASLEPYDAARQDLMRTMRELRPAMSGSDSESLHDDAQPLLFHAKMALDQHGMLSLAAGRKEVALEDFLTALRFDAATQTTALLCSQAEGGADQFLDTLRAALIDSPAGTWTDDELRRFDEVLKTACSGELTMKFQRMLLPKLFDLAARVRANPGIVPPRIDWKKWRNDWQWEWQSAKEDMKTAWRAVRPQGLRDLEVAGQLEHLADKLGNPGTPTDWQVPLWEMALFHEPAEEISYEICSEPYSSQQPLWDDFITYSEGLEIEGAMWTALGRWAIALERHRLRHARHPESLEALDADLRDGLPCDPLSKGSFAYRMREDGGYELRGAIPSWKKDKVYSWERVMER